MLISVAVRLLIPDTAAVSARRALQGHGLAQLADLRREQCWTFDVSVSSLEDARVTAARLLNTDVIVNQNKHRARWWAGPLEAAPEHVAAAGPSGCAWLLVETCDDPEVPSLQRLLTTRLGFTDVRVVRRATLWRVVAGIGADANELARHATTALLVNPHCQAVTLLGSSHSPVGAR